MERHGGETRTESAAAPEQFGDAVRDLRAELGRIKRGTAFTQQEFARALGVSSSTVSRWENGAKQPSTMARYALAGLAEQEGLALDPATLQVTARDAPEGAERPAALQVEREPQTPQARITPSFEPLVLAPVDPVFDSDPVAVETAGDLDDEYAYTPAFLALTAISALMLGVWWVAG